MSLPLLIPGIHRVGVDSDLGEKVVKESKQTRIARAKCLL